MLAVGVAEPSTVSRLVPMRSALVENAGLRCKVLSYDERAVAPSNSLE